MIHEVKCKQEYFKPLKDGRKTFEVRYNDRNYKVDDILVVKEIDEKGEYTGDSKVFKISYVLDNIEYCKKGYVILGIVKRSREK